MKSSTPLPADSPPTSAVKAEPAPLPSRVEVLVGNYRRRMLGPTNRLFVWLAGLEATGLAALTLRMESGPLAMALVIAGGLLLAALSIGLLRWCSSRSLARCGVALAQIGFCALFVQVAGSGPASVGLFFVAFVFLGLYCDWRVMMTAIGAATAYSLVGSWWLSEAVSGETNAGLGLGVVDLGLLALEGVVLIWAGRVVQRELFEICRREDQHQALLDQLEERVTERTKHLESETAERERTAQTLRQNEQRHRNLLATLPIGIFETDRSGQVRFANPFLLGLVGLPSHFDPTVISLADGRIFPMVDRERLWHRLENEREVRGFGATFRHFDGSAFDVVINARLKSTAAGEELMCEGTVEDVTARKRAERELEVLHGQLVLASRQAGMAEVATGVLHNIGNAMTSVNLIAHDVQDRLKSTRLTHLHRVVEVLEREKPRLAEFFAADAAGQKLPEFLAKLDEHLSSENRQLLTDVEGLVRHFEHIREIILTQQSSAQLIGVIEKLSPVQLFEDALRLNAESFDRHGITLERMFDASASVQADRHKVLQILVNLLKNAKDALQAVKPGERVVRMRVSAADDQRVALAVEDNGPGIAPEILTKIFQHGFTTKPTGRGYGLHNSVLAAREMGGDLTAVSDGPGKGSTFTLTLPVTKPGQR